MYEAGTVLNKRNFEGQAGELYSVSLKLLKCLLDIYKIYKGQWGEIKTSKEFMEFQENSAELQNVNLYASESALQAFWINIFNLLSLHIHVYLSFNLKFQHLQSRANL